MSAAEFSDNRVFLDKLSETVRTTSDDVKLIKDSLLGTLTDEGWISKIRTTQEDVKNLKCLKNEVVRNTWVIVISIIGFFTTFIIDKVKF